MSKKILAIDDDQIMIKLLGKRLTDKELVVFSAGNGKEALVKVKEVKPDLIILDVEMPEMNGYTFMLELHKLGEEFKEIPVIVLTSHEGKQPIFQLRGVKDYQVKPLDFDKLYAKIEELIIKNRASIGSKIFIVEENETQITLMTHFLNNALIENLVFLRSFDEFTNKIMEDKPEVAVINFSICLPDTTGYQICLKLKEQNPDIKVILLFSSADDVSEEDLKSSGADVFAVKSSDYSSLIDAITKVIV